MQSWCNLPCYHRTVLVATEGSEFVIIFCKFCRKAGFAAHTKLNKTIIDHESLKTSTQYKCVIVCSNCKREVNPFPVGNEALTLDFILHFNRPHIDLTEEEEKVESKIHENLEITNKVKSSLVLDPSTELFNEIASFEQTY